MLDVPYGRWTNIRCHPDNVTLAVSAPFPCERSWKDLNINNCEHKHGSINAYQMLGLLSEKVAPALPLEGTDTITWLCVRSHPWTVHSWCYSDPVENMLNSSEVIHETTQSMEELVDLKGEFLSHQRDQFHSNFSHINTNMHSAVPRSTYALALKWSLNSTWNGYFSWWNSSCLFFCRTEMFMYLLFTFQVRKNWSTRMDQNYAKAPQPPGITILGTNAAATVCSPHSHSAIHPVFFAKFY